MSNQPIHQERGKKKTETASVMDLILFRNECFFISDFHVSSISSFSFDLLQYISPTYQDILGTNIVQDLINLF